MNQREKFIKADIPYDDLDTEMIDLIDVLNFKLNLKTKFCCYRHTGETGGSYVIFHESVTDEQIYHLANQLNKLTDWGDYGLSFNKWVRFHPVKTNWKLDLKEFVSQDMPQKKIYIDSVVMRLKECEPMQMDYAI